MWQMTLEELIADSFKPVRQPIHLGSWSYDCPICGASVGIRTATEGFIYKRDICKNGHVVDWDI